MDLIHPDLSEKVLDKQKAQRAEQEAGKWWKELIERETWFTQGIISQRQKWLRGKIANVLGTQTYIVEVRD